MTNKYTEIGEELLNILGAMQKDSSLPVDVRTEALKADVSLRKIQVHFLSLEVASLMKDKP